MSDQQRLSEQLQILHGLKYSDLDMPYQAAGVHSNKHIRDKNTNLEMRILDTFAVSLTTGEPGDVVAAALDKRERLCLVLAKNSPPTLQDEKGAQSFISILTDPATTDSLSLLPFLLSRCHANMEKRVRNLHTSIIDPTLLDCFLSALETYTPLPDIDKEFPRSSIYHKKTHKNESPSFRGMLEDIITGISTLSASGLDAGDVPSSVNQYVDLVVVANFLLRSRFLKELIEDRNRLNLGRKELAERLERLLAKVCQYVNGTQQLVRRVRSLFPDGKIPYRWTNDAIFGTERSCELRGTSYDAVSKALG